MNAFEDFGEAHTRKPRPRPSKKQIEVLEQKREENITLLRDWIAWRRGEIDKALQGPYGIRLCRLIGVLKGVKHWADIKPNLIAHGWRDADPETQMLVRRIVNAFITNLRLAAKLEPFDDALEDLFR